MLRVTIDAFSGQPNPSYQLRDAEARELLRDVSRRRSAITDAAEGFNGLGFRGVVVESLTDDLAEDVGRDLPAAFRVGGGTAMDEANGLDLAERLVRGLLVAEYLEEPTRIDEPVLQRVLDLLGAPRSAGLPSTPDGPAPEQAAPGDDTCRIERSTFNPGFWNAAGTIGSNNCYNYASNWRTNTFAQPGRGAGQIYSSLSCPAVTAAALADGCQRRFVCFPDAEKPRRLVALVVWPGSDYHWYRIHSAAEGFWGHKPGSTAARNLDNSGRVITNPETCDRGPYTQFCGYFYTCNSQRLRIQ
jgi:hypothetical protein